MLPAFNIHILLSESTWHFTQKVLQLEQLDQPLRLPVPTVKPFAGHGIYLSRSVLYELQDILVVRANRYATEIVAVGIYAQPVDRSHPQTPARVEHHILNLVVGQTERIVRTEILLVLVGVVLVQSAKRSDPDMPLRILGESLYLLVGDALGKERTLRLAALLVDAAGTPARGRRQSQRPE